MIWVISAIVLGVICVFLQYWAVRSINPQIAFRSTKRVIWTYYLRLSLIGLYLWQLVQQGWVMILIGLSVFFFIYFGGVFFIALKKPQWLQTNGGRIEQWMQ